MKETIKVDRHVFDDTTAEQSVRCGPWFCSYGALFEDLGALVRHVDEVIVAESPTWPSASTSALL